MDADHKTAVVIGGGNDIGRATTLAFARRSTKAVMAGIDAIAARTVTELIKAKGIDARLAI